MLELGCGAGTTALRLAGVVRSYLANDVSSQMIKIAEEKHAAAPIPSLVLPTATAESVESPATAFDAILGFTYLHLVRELKGTLRCMKDLLKTGGLFIFKTPCRADMNPLIRTVMLPTMRAFGLAVCLRPRIRTRCCLIARTRR